MTPEQIKTLEDMVLALQSQVADLTEDNRELEETNAHLLRKVTSMASRQAPGVGAVIEAPASGSRYQVRWAAGDLLTFGESAIVSAWPCLAASGWKVVVQ